jgi:hypothetical protein
MKKAHKIDWKDWNDYKALPPKAPPVLTECGVILFNGDSMCPWQAYENTIVMVTNRIESNTGKFMDHFCRAADVRKGDNVWEHNIVEKIELIAAPKINVKIHQGQEQEGPGFIEENDDEDILDEDVKENIKEIYKVGDWVVWKYKDNSIKLIRKIKSLNPFAWENDYDNGQNFRDFPEEYRLATIEEIKR